MFLGKKSSTARFSEKKCWKQRQQPFFLEKSSGNAVNRAFFEKKVLETPSTALFFEKKPWKRCFQHFPAERSPVDDFYFRYLHPK